MAKKRKTNITPKHFVALSDAASSRTTISVYGKVIKDAAIQHGTSGVLHPSGRAEDLQLAQVVGYSDGGRCVTLAEPQLLALPAPDGPADGCGWDPQEYMVWKNLPKSWRTLHLQPNTRGLHSALSSSAATVAAAPPSPCLQLPEAIQLVRSCSNADPSLPLSTPLGQVLPTPTERISFCQCVADGVPIDRSRIRCAATNTLQDVVDDITC
jgi:hypothetical protein